MIDDRLVGMFQTLKSFRNTEPGTALHTMFLERTLPQVAASANHPKVQAYINREIGRSK